MPAIASSPPGVIKASAPSFQPSAPCTLRYSDLIVGCPRSGTHAAVPHTAASADTRSGWDAANTILIGTLSEIPTSAARGDPTASITALDVILLSSSVGTPTSRSDKAGAPAPLCRIRSAAHVRRSRAARRKYPRRPSSALRGRPFRARTPRRTGPRPAPGRRGGDISAAARIAGFGPACHANESGSSRRGTRNSSHNAGKTLPDLSGRSTYQATSSVSGKRADGNQWLPRWTRIGGKAGWGQPGTSEG